MSEFVGLGGGGGVLEPQFCPKVGSTNPKKRNISCFHRRKTTVLWEIGGKNFHFFAPPCIFFPHISLITEEEERKVFAFCLEGKDRRWDNAK